MSTNRIKITVTINEDSYNRLNKESDRLTSGNVSVSNLVEWKLADLFNDESTTCLFIENIPPILRENKDV